MSHMSEIHAELTDLLGRALDVADKAGLAPRDVATLLDEMLADAEAAQAAARLEAAGAPLPRTDVHMLERVDVYPAWSPEDRKEMADAMNRAIDEHLDVEVQPWQRRWLTEFDAEHPVPPPRWVVGIDPGTTGDDVLLAGQIRANQIAVRPSIYPPVQAARVFTADDVAAIEDGAQ